MDNLLFLEKERKGPVGLIRLNRPNVLNALNRQLISEIVQTFEEYDRDEEIRVIVLTGNGRAFAAGADIEEMADEDAVGMELLNQFADWDRITAVKKPIIAAVNGFALGGGFELALACDLLFASETAKFGFPEVNLGVMPGAGGTQRLTKAAGKTKALEMIWSGEMISAEEALRLNLINRVIAPELLLEETLAFAGKIAEKAPLAVRLIKESVYKALDISIYEGMQFERKNFYLLFASEDQKEGMQAFMEKRKPVFKGK
ncbi:enoyl-CoA hydratase-related protein [Metabacillus sp. GX 13764]|uniref:enoyl-CoA hydratase-related protein n=1 Tax=Metabacillus kandeliae TaxID=2900151 RepID=UPI001E2A7DF5|nr:enoyl-CoA hydratase-related protein [Metabacillus kandeliae]MCD7036465.1 enoyl-CoA hydratase-related protein [Metabacillus kandeliae]